MTILRMEGLNGVRGESAKDMTPGYGKTSYALRSSRNRIRQSRVGGSRSLSETIQTSGPDLGETELTQKIWSHVASEEVMGQRKR